LLEAGATGGACSLLASWGIHAHQGGGLAFRAPVFFGSLARYFPVCFVLEEVAFRGALDAHVYHPGDRYAKRTAVAVSALWGLWHLGALPLTPSLVPVAPLLAMVHVLTRVWL